MAQFRSTSDILDLALQKAGEVTNGNSPYETQALNYMNRVYHTLISGGTIPIGKDSTVEIDEVWPWSKSKYNLILELQPKYSTGTVSLTLGSEAGTFSSAPSYSVEGWFLQIDGRPEWFRIGVHTAGDTAFELDAHYTNTTGATLNFKVVKLDYELVPSHIVVSNHNNKIQFQEVAGTTLTGTLTNGTYTPSQLAAQIETILNAIGGAPAYTVTYSSTTRKFTIASDRASSSIFVLVGTGDNSAYSIHPYIGFDYENTTNAASITSTYVLGGISRLIEPFKIHNGSNLDGGIYGIDAESFQRDYPFTLIDEGVPERFTVVREYPDGTLVVRFNRYPTEKTRVEVEHVPVPLDLKDNSASIPLIPRKHIDILEDAATFYLMLDKSDDRAQVYSNLLQGKLKAMIAQHRGSQLRSGQNFGQMISRLDLINVGRRKLTYGSRD